MGIRATLTVISSTTYRRVVTRARAGGGAWITYSNRYVSFDLDKAWIYLTDALSGMGEPLKSCFFGDFDANPETPDMCCHLASPRLVKQIAAELAKLPFERIRERLVAESPWCQRDEAEIASKLEYVRHFYVKLRRAYALAARRGGAMHIERS